MRTPIMAGNWKMNLGTVGEATALVRGLRPLVHDIESVEVVLCPPFIVLASVREQIQGSRMGMGAQNVHWEEKGAFTGEISPVMLADLCQYVIIGHSERRQFFGETDERVNRKVQVALAHGLKPILCVGEDLEQNEAGRTDAIVGAQVAAALQGVKAEQVRTVVIAYEPIWAIGTGKAATAAGANSVIGLSVRGTLADLFGEDTAQAVRVQYGGSANASNIASFMEQPEIDGALVGGASLKAQEFGNMVKETARVSA